MTTSTEQIISKNSTWWKRRTSLERALTAMSVCGILLSIGLIIGIEVIATKIRTCDRALADVTSNNDRSRGGKASKLVGKDSICLSPECIHTASAILGNMDQDVDPCDNFYEFACGSFVKNTLIPDDQPSVDTFSMIDDDLQMQLRSSIEEEIKPNEKNPFRLTKILYQSCMNKSLIEEMGLEPLFKILRKLGGWPVLLSSWNDKDFDWKEVVYRNRKIGFSVDHFISFDIDVDPKNSSQRMITLDQAWLALPREYLSKGLGNDVVRSYYNYMVDIAVILGGDRDRVTKELRESLDFEISLANISMPSEKRRNASELYNPMTIEDLSRVYPTIPWLTYLNHIMEPFVRLEPNEMINVKEPKFIAALEKLMRVTPKRVQANYALWRVVRDSVDYLDEEIRKRQLTYWTEVTGEAEREPRQTLILCGRNAWV